MIPAEEEEEGEREEDEGGREEREGEKEKKKKEEGEGRKEEAEERWEEEGEGKNKASVLEGAVICLHKKLSSQGGQFLSCTANKNTVISPFFAVEVFSDGTHCPKTCSSNIVPLRKYFSIETFSHTDI